MICPVDSQECQIRGQCTNKCGRLDRVTPDIEHYIRCSVTVGQWTVEPGIEYRDGDDESVLASGIECMASAICGAMHEPHAPGPMAVSKSFEWSFRSRWPGRAFFIEIHSTDHRWTQTFQPYGVPRRQDPLSDEPNLWRDLYGQLSQVMARIHATLGGGPEELAEDAAKRVVEHRDHLLKAIADERSDADEAFLLLSPNGGESLYGAAKRVVADRDFHMRKVYDAVNSARRAKDELDACKEELRVATADRDRHAENEDRLLDLNTQLSSDAGLRTYLSSLDASLDSWRTQAQSLANQVLSARDAIDGRNADTLAEAIQALRSELGTSDGETLRQAVMRVLTERDDAVSRLEGV